MELPVKSLFDRYEDRKLLADIPSWVLEKNINITFKYKLYFKILFELLKEGEVVDIDIDSIISNDFSDSRGSIEIDYHHRIYADSVYNEDKTQKLKFDVEGYVYYIGGDEEAINLSFNKLEINDKVFIDENNNPRYLKIIISRKRNTKINLNKQTVV